MGGVIGKAANGIGGVIGSAFAAPIKTIFGASCEYAIDTMQSVCLKEAGVKALGSLEEETTLMGLTFGGYLRLKADEESIYQALSTTVGVLDSIEATIAKFFSKQIETVLFILTELRSMFELEDEFLEELELAIALVSTLLDNCSLLSTTLKSSMSVLFVLRRDGRAALTAARLAGGSDSGEIGGRKIDRLREREIDRERERSEWMEDGGGQIDRFGGGVEWVGNRWWPDQLVRWRAWWSTAYDRLSRLELNLYSSVHGWRSERWVLGVSRLVMREGWAEIFKSVMSVSKGGKCTSTSHPSCQGVKERPRSLKISIYKTTHVFSQPQAGSDIGSIANSPPHAGYTNDSAGQSHLTPHRDHGLRRKNYMLNRPVGPMINKHSQPKPQQPILSFNQSYHLLQPQQTTSQAQPSHPQADTAGFKTDLNICNNEDLDNHSPTNSVMGCSNYKSGCPSGPVINNPGPQQQIQEAPECHNNQPCKFGQPIGREAAKLSSFMGTIAQNGYIAPLTYVSWRAVPDAAKEDMWQIFQSSFNIDPKGKSWVMKSLATKWRSFKFHSKG
uniref:Uncharacterized protein n=1 Tax=Quercus lobata TaxID=97700 RepID=A0A7N2MU87_QUELO